MNIERNILKVAIVFVATFCMGTLNLSSQTYRLPLNLAPSLSGNFGELRATHFHGGLDFRVGGVSGAPVYAVMDGYISRLSVSPSGYGHALYIQHPNGRTTVYGHLMAYSPAVEKWVRNNQYEKESFSVTLYPDSTMFRVKKGDLLGKAGNTGSSGGPHLHFEIRNSETEITLDPAKECNYSVTDNIPPLIERISLYGISNSSNLPVRTFIKSISAAEKLPVEVSDTFYVAVGAIDRMNASGARFAVYAYRYYLDNEQIFSFNTGGISFEKGRYINSILEYPQKENFGRSMIKSWVEPGSALKGNIRSKNEGLFVLMDNVEHTVRVELEDNSGNKTAKSFRVKRNSRLRPALPDSAMLSAGVLMPWYLPNIWENGNLRVELPVGSLYSSVLFTSDSVPAPPGGFPVWRVHNSSTPVHSGARISIRAAVPSDLKEKAFIASVSENGRLSYRGGEWKGERLETGLGQFGKYTIAYDTVKPKILPALKEGENLAGRKSIRFTIFDEMSGISSYRVTVDGKWVLASYDPKSRSLVAELDRVVTQRGKRHTVEVTVSDSRANSTTVTREFIW